jgi:hypothetical protein
MPNAARDLHELLSGWSPVPANQASESTRGYEPNRASNLGFWRRQAHAVALLHAIEEHLAGMAAHGDDVEHYVDGLPAWYAAVFSFEAPWGSAVNGQRPLLDPRDLRLLRALAGAIDALRLVPVLVDEQVAGILASLDRTDDLVRHAGDVDEQVRRYLLGLVAEARRVTADWQTFGPEAVRSATLELGGALYTMAEQTQQPAAKEGWRGAARDVTVQFLGSTIAQGAIAASGEVLKQL